MGFRLKKSQVAMEFIFLIVLAFMIMVIFAVVAKDEMVDLRKEGEYIYLKDVIHTVHSEITIASSVENGYIREFTIPLLLDGINYTIEISDGYLVAESRHHEYVLKVSPVVGELAKGFNTIKKEDGVVYLNE